MHKVGPGAYARLIAALGERPRSMRALAEITGLHYVTVLDYVGALHEHGQVHITDYERDSDGRQRAAKYLLGPGVDAKRTPLSATQRQQRWRDRQRKEKELPPSKESKRKKPPINSVFALGGALKDDIT